MTARHAALLAVAAAGLWAGPAWAAHDDVEAAYGKARKAYQELRSSESKRRQRDVWLDVAGRFQSIAEKNPRSPRAVEALFTAGVLFRDLSVLSGLDKDRMAAEAALGSFCQKYPTHRLSDDARLALGKLAMRRGDFTEARRQLSQAMALRGDCRQAAGALLEKIGERDHGRLVAAAARMGKRGPALEPEPSEQRRAIEERPKGKERAERKMLARRASPPVPLVKEERGAGRLAAAEEAPVAADPDTEAVVDEDSEPEKAEAEPVAELTPKARPGASSPRAPATKPDRAALNAIARAERRAEVPLAVQAGLKVRRVVIDAGHGGYDTGAVGAAGTEEKTVTLGIAQKLAQKLKAARFEVVMTRNTDEYLSLEQRAATANREGADLFISVHANAHQKRSLSGIETYTLNVTHDRYAVRLAARENRLSERKVSDLELILADLCQKANTEESLRLAKEVQEHLVRGLSTGGRAVRDLGNKQALFYVLLGTKAPAILVETGFITNREEERRLAQDSYQAEVAEQIAAGVEGFVNERAAIAMLPGAMTE